MKKRIIFTILYLMLASIAALAQEVKTYSVYDTNQSGDISVSDISDVVDKVKKNVTANSTQQYVTADDLVKLLQSIQSDLKMIKEKLGIAGSESAEGDNPETGGETQAKKRKTVVVYMAAENSLSRFTNSDINEMVAASANIPNDCNFVLYVDDTGSPTVYTINSIGGKAEYKVLSERNSCDPDVFKSTMQEILTDFPADAYSLVMWSHGSGWIPTPKRTIGIDNNKNIYQNLGSELEIPEMRKALESLGVHWDYIFFDACFMQCVETGYELRNVADYVIGSPAEIPGNGAPYGTIMPELTGTTNDASILSLVEKYYNAYASDDGVVISAVKTKELPQLLNVTKSLVPDYYTKAYSLPTEGIQMYCPYHFMASNKPEYFDMASTMNQMLSTDSYAQWEKQMQKTVFVRRFSDKWYSIYESYFNSRITDPTHIAALSIFIPNEKYDEETTYNEYIKQTQWYQDYVK